MMGDDAVEDTTPRVISTAVRVDSDSVTSEQPYQPLRSASAASIKPENVTENASSPYSNRNVSRNGSRVQQRPRSATRVRRASLSSQVSGKLGFLDRKEKGAQQPPADGTKKLGTFSGVFVPTTLNVLSILMFLRFGFILGQTGVLGMMGEYKASERGLVRAKQLL